MSKITNKRRQNLPDSAFAGPGRSYPIPDKSHAANAKARAAQEAQKGNLTRAQKAIIDARANRVLDKGK